MAAPARVVADHMAAKHYESPPAPGGSWRADRPGETIGATHPSSGSLGNQGPDQGYAWKLARQFVDDLVLVPGENAADAVEGACAVALRRASLHGRAPVADDVGIGLVVWGFLAAAPDELVELRRRLFAELHHSIEHGGSARAIADRIPESTLRMSAAEVSVAHTRDWRALLEP